MVSKMRERDEILANLTRATEGKQKSSPDYKNSTEKTVFACGEYTVGVLLIKLSSWSGWLNRCTSISLIVASSHAMKEQEN